MTTFSPPFTVWVNDSQPERHWSRHDTLAEAERLAKYLRSNCAYKVFITDDNGAIVEPAV